MSRKIVFYKKYFIEFYLSQNLKEQQRMKL